MRGPLGVSTIWAILTSIRFTVKILVYFVHRTKYKDIQLYTVYKWDSEESLQTYTNLYPI